MALPPAVTTDDEAEGVERVAVALLPPDPEDLAVGIMPARVEAKTGMPVPEGEAAPLLPLLLHADPEPVLTATKLAQVTRVLSDVWKTMLRLPRKEPRPLTSEA